VEDDDEDDFATIYSKLVKVFRSPIIFSTVFPLSLQLLRKHPPEKLEVYVSMSQWSCYKTTGVTSDWLKDGMLRLQNATNEQYGAKAEETATEATRRKSTALRQKVADAAMQQNIEDTDHEDVSHEKLLEQLERTKEEAICDGERIWKAREEVRIQAEIKQKERIEREKELYKAGKWEIAEINYWAILIGGTAIMGAVLAIMKGYRYI
jgi:hypothetical protein